jgi:ABC-type multidrug transport system fused ATPase/permease subunit
MTNIWFTWGDVFNSSLQSLWWSLVQFTPKLLVAIIFFIIGWVLGEIISKAIEQIFRALKIDKLFASVGAEGFFRRAGMNLNTGYFVGEVAKWFVIIVFLLPSLDLVGLNSIKDFLQTNVLGFLPHVIVAAFVLIIATLVSQGLSATITAATRSMSLRSAHLLGAVAKYAVWTFAFIIALGELGVAEYYMSVLFAGIIFMFALGSALAFGLGGRDAAAKFLSKLGEEVAHK